MGMCELSAQGARLKADFFLNILIEFACIYIRNWKRVYTGRQNWSCGTDKNHSKIL